VSGRALISRVATFALALGLWVVPIPEGLTAQAWHLFAIFAAAIFSVIVAAFPLLTSAMLAAGAAVLTGTIAPAKAFAGFANGSVLLVVVAFLVASSVVKSGLGQRISFLVVSAFGRSTLGLAYSIFLTDAAIAPAFPSNTARSGVQHVSDRPPRSPRARARSRTTRRRGGSAAISCSAAWRASPSPRRSG
jgi:DASS family divalent anion:Na+ symporter